LLALQNDEFPMVFLDMTAPGLRADLVASDHEAGAYLATRYLLDRGHRRILLLTHPPVSSSVAARIAGYDRALLLSGIQSPPEWKAWIDLGIHLAGYHEGRMWWGGCQAILPLLRSVERPLAVLAVDSYTGWGVYEACRELGLRIPEDVSVMAFDDVDITRALSPPMTVISQRTDEIARVGLELLDARIQAKPPALPGRRDLRQVLMDMDLIERGSVANAG
jgi:LacI family transcriptional regulator